MEDLEKESVLNLTTKLNQIERKIFELNVEYLMISEELQKRIPSLKGDKDLLPKLDYKGKHEAKKRR